MVKDSKPRAGSLAFWPRKRAKRIYPRASTWPETDKLKVLGFAGYKAGMLRITMVDPKKNSPTYGQDITVPVTVIDCPALKVLGIRVYKKTPNGLIAFTEVWDEDIKKDKDIQRKLILGDYKLKEKITTMEKVLEEVEDVRLIIKTRPRVLGIGKKTPEIFELGVGGPNAKEKWNYCKNLLGKEIKISDVFRDGELVDVTSITKGKGTQGPVKRFGVKIQVRKAAQKRRHVGSLGAEGVRRVLWTVPMAGQMGFQKRTEYNKRILKIGEKKDEITPKSGFNNYGVVKGDYVLLEGSIPGPRKRLITLRFPIRPSKTPFLTHEIKRVG